MVKSGTSRHSLAIMTGIAASLLLAGCMNFSALDDLKDVSPPTDTPFNQALFQDYAFLAHSFGDVGQASYTAFDQDGSVSLNKSDNNVAALANAYASKALQLTRGELADPEPSTNPQSHGLRDRLVRALDPGRDAFPRDAARAQADYDCWMMNLSVPSQGRAAATCRASLDVTLPRLEAEIQTLPKPAAAATTPAASEPKE